MATINELKEVLKETLEEKGVLAQIRARIRAEIFNSLNTNQSDKPEVSLGTKFKFMMHLENMIINDLIREYMEYNNYVHSLSVFGPETGMPDEQLDRNFIAKKLKIVEDSSSKKMPLIYGLVFGMKKMVAAYQEKEVQIENDPTAANNYRNVFPVTGQIVENRDQFEYQGQRRPLHEDIFK